jgi:hypothetical protein
MSNPSDRQFRGKSAAALTLALIPGFLLLAGCDARPVALVLRLEPEAVTVRTGEQLPVTLRLSNPGDTAAYLVMPGDGSSYGWRTPIVGWSVIDAGLGEKQHPAEPGLSKEPRCGNIDALGREELIELLPGQGTELLGYLCVPVLRHPGEYRLSFYYRNAPDLQWTGLPLGEHDPGAMDWVRNSTEVELWSNEIRVTVEPHE